MPQPGDRLRGPDNEPIMFTGDTVNDSYLGNPGYRLLEVTTADKELREVLFPAGGVITDTQAPTPEEETGITVTQAAQIYREWFITSDAQQKADVLTDVVPGIKITQDKESEALVAVLPNGKQFFINKPGLSMQDASNFVNAVFQFMPAGKIVSFAGNLVTRMGLGAITAGTTQGGLDLAAGGEVNLPRASGASIGGAAGEILLPIIAPLFRKGVPLVVDGEITPQAMEALTGAGITPEAVTPDMLAGIEGEARRLMSRGVEAAEAIGAAAGREFSDVPLLRFERSTDPNVRMSGFSEIERARGADLTSSGAQRIREFDQERAGGLQRTQETLQAEAGQGSRPLPTRSANADTEAGEQTQEALQRRTRELRGEERATYNRALTATQGAPRAYFSGESAIDFTRRIIKTATDIGVDPQLTPAAASYVSRISRLNSVLRRSQERGRLRPFDIRMIDRERRRLNKLKGKDATDRLAIAKLRDQYNQWVDEAVDNALISGDDEALDLLKKAVGISRQRFAIVSPKVRGASGRIKEDVRSANALDAIVEGGADAGGTINYLFGASKIGHRQLSRNLMGHIVEVFGKDSAEVGALKQAAVARIFKRAFGKDGEINGASLHTDLERALEGDSLLLMKKLFSAEEIARLTRFKDHIKKLIPPRRVPNNSNSTNMFLRVVNKWIPHLVAITRSSARESAIVGAAMFGFEKAARNPINLLRVRQAMDQHPVYKTGDPLSVFIRAEAAAMGRELSE